MGEWSANNQARARVVWDRLLGLFGDTLIRKFDAEPPEEWVSAIGMLNDGQIERGLRRMVFGWKGGVPNLPDFVRLCRAIGDDAPDDGQQKLVALPAPGTDQKFDGWDISANNRFWKYVTKRLTDSPHAWGTSGSTRQADATRVAVGYKNAWAQDMRESDKLDTLTGEVVRLSEDQQSSTWNECMRRAEADIAVFLAGKAA